MYAILDKDGNCSTIRIPGAAGDFHIPPLFVNRKDARMALKSLPVDDRKIVRVIVTMLRH
jgi:hypothetical protein